MQKRTLDDVLAVLRAAHLAIELTQETVTGGAKLLADVGELMEDLISAGCATGATPDNVVLWVSARSVMEEPLCSKCPL